MKKDLEILTVPWPLGISKIHCFLWGHLFVCLLNKDTYSLETYLISELF